MLGVPKMQDTQGETSILASNPATDEAQHEVRIFVAPALVAFVKSIDGTKIISPHPKIAGLDPPPAARASTAQRAKRQVQQR